MTEAIPDSRRHAGESASGPGLKAQAAEAIAAHYGIAILAMAAALAIRLALEPILVGDASYIFYMPAILIASAYGGWGPGILATVLGLFIGLFFVADSRAVSSADVVNSMIFVFVGVGASWRT